MHNCQSLTKPISLFMYGQILCTFAGALQFLCLSLWLLRITGQASSLAVFAIASTVPNVIFTIFGGHIADALPPIRSLKIAVAVKLFTIGIFTLIMGKVIPFCLLSVLALESLSRVAACVEGPILQKLLKELNSNKSALQIQGSFNLSVFAAQTAAYLTGGIFTCNKGGENHGMLLASTLLIGYLIILHYLNRFDRTHRIGEKTRLSFNRSNLKSIAQLAMDSREIRMAVLIMVLFSLSGARYFQLLPVLTEKTFAECASYLGLFSSITCLGSAIGGAALSRIRPDDLISFASRNIALTGLAVAMLGLSQSMPVICISLFISGILYSMTFGALNTAIQENCPPGHEGKLSSIRIIIQTLSESIGAVFYTRVADGQGYHQAFFVMAIFSIIFGVIPILLARSTKQRRQKAGALQTVIVR